MCEETIQNRTIPFLVTISQSICRGKYGQYLIKLHNQARIYPSLPCKWCAEWDPKVASQNTDPRSSFELWNASSNL